MKLLLIVLLALLAPALAQAQILWRVSIKQILSPHGSLAPCTEWRSQADAERAIDEANAILDATCRGVRLLLTDYTVVPNANSFWILPPTPENVGTIEDYALANGYGWRSDAVNVYLTQAAGAFIGYCSSPGGNRSTIIIACTGGRPRGQLLLHEIGHFFDLGHTFDGSTCCNRETNPTCAHTFRPTGLTADLIPDLSCDYPDDIARNWFGRPVAGLNSSEFELFSVTYSNLMTYHSETFRLSEIQSDIMAITANTARFNTANGRTRFVSNFGFIFGAGSRTTPSLSTVTQGVSAASPGDIVLIYAGRYNEPQTIIKPVTLRATRGSATIGAP